MGWPGRFRAAVLAAAPFFVVLAFLFLRRRTSPPLSRSLRADLIAAGKEYAAKQGIDPVPLRVEDVWTSDAPNAYGRLPGRAGGSILEHDLDGSFDKEVKRCSRTSSATSPAATEGIAWYALFAPGGLADRRRHAPHGNPAAVPLAARDRVADLLSLPVYSLISRHRRRRPTGRR